MIRIRIQILLTAFMLVAIFCGYANALPDQYPGDTSIYGGLTSEIQPNVLIIFDNSGSMNELTIPGQPYDPATAFPSSNACGGQPCATNTVYKCTAFGLECGNWTTHIADVNNVTTTCGGTNPKNTLLTTGQWNSGSRRLTTTGACASGSGIYATGNWINWRQQTGPARKKIDVAKDVVKNLLNSTSGVKFGIMNFNNNQGGTLLSVPVSGQTYTAAVKDMDAIFTGTTTNRSALVSAVDTITASTWTPLAETLFESMRYYQGGASAFNVGTYTSPIQASCQKNYVVIVTDGMSTQDNDNVLRTICTGGANGIPGDCDQDGFEPANDPAKTYPNQGSDYLDDVAKYMYDNDMSSAFAGKQNVITYTVGFGLSGSNAGAVKLLGETATNGGGVAFTANNQQQLADALTQILAQIFEVNTSFVAPVVPVSPENRTFSGTRLYMGFFKPVSQRYWHGNLKKFGLDTNLDIVDKNGNKATYVDVINNTTKKLIPDGLDDNTGAPLPLGVVSGTFKDTSISYWSPSADGSDVENGGVGELLIDRLAARNIYTYLGSSPILSDSSNAFAKTNAAITTTTLGVATDADKDKLIDFVHGVDVYDENANLNMTEKRGWLLGDILHSKPTVVHYASYTASDEGNCSANKSKIYVGSNDGMLHAFNDCDGSEAWGFIPPEMLGNLKELNNPTRNYFADSSVSTYIYDSGKDGSITVAGGDKIILIFGLRRGGGANTAPTVGGYYALDVTDPASPKYLWSIKGSTAGFSELGEAWSEPRIVKMNIGGTKKIVAFFGAGYDNANEDSRYGATQTFNGTGIVSNTDNGGGAFTSPGSSSALNPKGRGIYAVEIATLDANNVPSITASVTQLWAYTYANNAAMTFGFPGEITVLDTADFDGLVDRLYAGDTGGNLWRFDVGASSTASWTATKLFSSNSGTGTDVGRKMFYKPSVSVENSTTVSTRGKDAIVVFGTGDREHPLNTNVVDRLYSFKDKGQTTTKTEADLMDFTTDPLQTTTIARGTGPTPAPGSIEDLNASLDASYGWFIKLNERAGEKLLAPPLVSNKRAQFPTYAPDNSAVTDPCKPGNLGTGRLYVVNYKNGVAVENFDTTNDSTITSNKLANSGDGVLLRNDRVRTLGSGIPSGIVPIITPGGKSASFVAIGGASSKQQDRRDRTTKRIYWRQK